MAKTLAKSAVDSTLALKTSGAGIQAAMIGGYVILMALSALTPGIRLQYLLSWRGVAARFGAW